MGKTNKTGRAEAINTADKGPDTIPVAIIGLGRIASLLEDDSRREKPCTHAGAVAARGDCRLAAGCDCDAERRRLFAERWHTPVYADALRMLREHQPGILVVATHPDSHETYCRLAAAQGIPVVICEKPLADTLEAAGNIEQLTRRKSRETGAIRIITNHERRYQADYHRAKDILETQRLGPLLSVRGLLYMGKNRRLIDVLWHDGTHLADAVMFLTGCGLRHRSAWGGPLKAREGTAYLEADLRPSPGPRAAGIAPSAKKPAAAESGRRKPIPCVFEVGAGRDYLAFEIECSCEQGRLRIGNGVYEVWESAESPYADGFRSLALAPDRFSGKTGYFTNMIADAVACARDPARRPQSSAADGLAVIRYLDAVTNQS
jgi:predicted dehydrogenase